MQTSAQNNNNNQKMAFIDDEDGVPISHAARRNYEDEDTTPTTDREVKGWYGYTIAAEVYAVVAVGT